MNIYLLRQKRRVFQKLEEICPAPKQTLKLADFLGHSANAVRWQVWSALLCYLLLRFQAFLSSWGQQFHAALHPDSICSAAAFGLA